MKYLKSLFLALFAMMLLASCGKSEEETVYDIACEAVRESLVSPSSGKFEPYDDNSGTEVVILDSNGFGNPMMTDKDWLANPDTTTELGKSQAELLEAKAKYNGTPYSVARATVTYDASNRLGVMIQGRAEVWLKKWLYKDDSESTWKVEDIEKAS
ncbi:MAG: hypothetical protein KGZ71_09830 [Desulfobulbaceae bacterium]|nr:hypothetical protein [Desulfobulbaceae bacterium]